MTRTFLELSGVMQAHLHVQTGTSQRPECRRLKALAEGRGNILLARGGINTMFRAQQPSIQLPQTDKTGMTEREGENDSGSGTCYDGAADNDIKENGRPHETQTH